jgi:thiamine transporter ThiT
MSTNRTIKKITRVFLFIALAVVFASCNNGQGMMYDNNSSMGMYNWNWVQFIIGIGIGLLIGFIVGFLIFNKKK